MCFTVASPLRHEVGECPTWDERRQTLLWTSITEGSLAKRSDARPTFIPISMTIFGEGERNVY